MFHFFGKGESGALKAGKGQLIKLVKSCYIVIEGPGISFQSLAMSQKHVTNVIQHGNIWPNFILIVLSIQKK